MHRLISKTPMPPKTINNRLRALLTELCFGCDVSIDKADLIFVYGTPFFFDAIAIKLTALVQAEVADKVLITGGIMPYGEPHTQQKSEARLIYNRLKPKRFAEVDFFLEERLQNTLDNVVEGLKIVAFHQYKKVCFIFPAHGARRGYLTLKNFCLMQR